MDASQHISTHTLWDLRCKDWLKMQLCFFTLKEALEPFVEEECESLYRELTSLCQNCTRCASDDFNRNPSGLCVSCKENWKTKIQQLASGRYTVNWRNKDMFIHPDKYWSLAKCFVSHDQKDKCSASTCDINALLIFIVNCTRFAEERFGDIQINAKKVRRDRKRSFHRDQPEISKKMLMGFKNNMVNLLKTRNLKATEKADYAMGFIEKVSGDDYILSLEDVLKAKFSELEGKMELTLISHYNLVGIQLLPVNDEIISMGRKLYELDKQHDPKFYEPDEKLEKFQERSRPPYILPSYRKLRVIFSILQAKMEITLTGCCDLILKRRQVEDEIQLLRSKIMEFLKQEAKFNLNKPDDLYEKLLQKIDQITKVLEVDLKDQLNEMQNQSDAVKDRLEYVKNKFDKFEKSQKPTVVDPCLQIYRDHFN